MKQFILLLCISTGTAASAADEKVDYLRDVKPILAKHCYQCHGGAKQRGGLRLDTAKHALQGGDAGSIIVPGRSAQSKMVIAIRGGVKGVRKMPPRDEVLSDKQITLIAKWIDDGAKAPENETGEATIVRSDHWSFQPIKRPALPAVKNRDWTRNPIDRFILARLEAKNVRPSPEASRATLIRRLYFDLIGLPPTPAEVCAFVSDASPNAYEKVVDQLLASPHYGERWGRYWLDLARYADSNGFTIDGAREIWPYRDWVIKALNRDLPFDRFTIEQLAGDLLPSASREQLVATGFHRNTLFNQEGGIDREQFRVEFVVDRVGTTGSVFLGLTIGCAQCHDHKFDPVTTREFYQMFAFFNSCDEPTISLPTPEQERERKRINAAIAVLQQAQKQLDQTSTAGQARWEKGLTTADVEMLSREIQTILALAPNSRNRKQADRIAEVYREIDMLKHGLGAVGATSPLTRLPHLQILHLRRTANAKINALKKSMPDIPTTLILRERKTPRPTTIMIQGDFTRKGRPVAPGVPAVMHEMKPSDRPTRLDLAKWLVDPNNPLTARVAVNRYWQRYFGLGIVETENDFGTQGTPPSHPELMDWLASEFVKQQWSMKAVHRLIVTSATYRQSSDARPDLKLIDPRNRLLARQNRLRLDAEIVRDNALAVSGLLTRRIGGPSVFPPQPEGVYAFTQVNKNWKPSKGENRYRRGAYTYFWRSAPHPGLMAFDSPDSNTTCTRRNRSNTPVQALTLLNDEAFFECARGLAVRVVRDVDGDDRARVRYLFQACLARMPSARELDRFERFVNKQRLFYRASKSAAAKPASTKPSESEHAAEIAAWLMAARVMLNLDEIITRE